LGVVATAGELEGQLIEEDRNLFGKDGRMMMMMMVNAGEFL
jgi:hypothetical protein